MESAKRLGRLAIAAGVTLGAATIAAAVTSGTFEYSQPQTGAYAIGPADLGTQATDANTIQYSRSAIFFSTDDPAGSCFMAPVHLPQGAKIVRVETNFESGETFDPFFRLMQTNQGREWFTIMASYFSNSDNGTRRTRSERVPPEAERVDNLKYLYDYEICLGDDDVFYSAAIVYQFNTAGD